MPNRCSLLLAASAAVSDLPALAPRGERRSRPLARQSGRQRRSSRARSSTRRAPRRRPGTSSSTLSESGLDYNVGDAFGLYPTNDPALVDAILKALDAPPDFPIGGRTLARGADRRRLAVARARHAVPALLLHHRRRAAEKGQGAGGGRRSGRRRRDARRARRDREIPRRAARSGGLHRGARSAAAAALFDLVVAEGAQRPLSSHCRHGALRHRQAHAGSASPRRSSPTASSRATRSRSTCRRRTPSACRPIPPCRSS